MHSWWIDRAKWQAVNLQIAHTHTHSAGVGSIQCTTTVFSFDSTQEQLYCNPRARWLTGLAHLLSFNSIIARHRATRPSNLSGCHSGFLASSTCIYTHTHVQCIYIFLSMCICISYILSAHTQFFSGNIKKRKGALITTKEKKNLKMKGWCLN